MSLRDIVAHTFRFHRAIYISLTQKCPIKCRHCFVESGPERQEVAGLAAFRRWIDGVVLTPGLDIVFLSGGEPFSHPLALKYAVTACAATQRYSVVATSAFWAKSQEIAGSVLDKYPRPSCLCISTDIYHEEFVPLENIRFAATAAKERGIHVTVQIAESPVGYREFMERYERLVGFELIPESEIFVAEFGTVGRATTLVPDVPVERSRETLETPGAPCVWLGTPWLHEDGTLCACPNLEVFHTPSHPLRVGNLNQETFTESSHRASADYYIQWLRVLGPKALTDHFPLQEWGWTSQSLKGSGICDLCNSISRAPGLVARIREAIEAEKLTEKIDALRLSYYGELRVRGADGNSSDDMSSWS